MLPIEKQWDNHTVEEETSASVGTCRTLAHHEHAGGQPTHLRYSHDVMLAVLIRDNPAN